MLATIQCLHMHSVLKLAVSKLINRKHLSLLGISGDSNGAFIFLHPHENMPHDGG